MVRAKFTVVEHHQRHYNASGRNVVLMPSYDESVPEDARFSKATPSGRMEMFVDNPAALEQLQLGKAVYLDITPVE